MGSASSCVMKHSLVLLLYLQLVQGMQKNCNFQLENKIVNFEYESQPGYQLGLYEKNLGRAGTQLLLSLVWAGESLNYKKAVRPGALWIVEKCRDQLCFSRMKYDERELGDYYKSIKDEKNYIYMSRFSGLTVRHVMGYKIERYN